jgi:hypothetical protein
VQFLDEVKSMLGAVLVLRNRTTEGVEVGVKLRRRTSVDFLAECQQYETVHETQDAKTGLMDRQYHDASCLGNLLKRSHLLACIHASRSRNHPTRKIMKHNGFA